MQTRYHRENDIVVNSTMEEDLVTASGSSTVNESIALSELLSMEPRNTPSLISSVSPEAMGFPRSEIIERNGGHNDDDGMKLAPCCIGDGASSTSSNDCLNNNALFPRKLYHMLERTQHDGLRDIVSWVPNIQYPDPANNGTESYCDGFIVFDRTRFVSDIIPKYLQGTSGKKSIQYRSFVRQLNLYGFERINSGPHRGAYVHKLLRKGYPDLSDQIERVGSGVKNQNTSDATTVCVAEYSSGTNRIMGSRSHHLRNSTSSNPASIVAVDSGGLGEHYQRSNHLDIKNINTYSATLASSLTLPSNNRLNDGMTENGGIFLNDASVEPDPILEVIDEVVGMEDMVTVDDNSGIFSANQDLQSEGSTPRKMCSSLPSELEPDTIEEICLKRGRTGGMIDTDLVLDLINIFR